MTDQQYSYIYINPHPELARRLQVPKITRTEREQIAEKRLFSILAAHGIATARTLEQKISDAGPYGQRIDPHILTEVRNDMVRAKKLARQLHGNTPWYSIVGADSIQIAERLALQLPVYKSINSGNISSRVGQALEIATYRSLLEIDAEFYGRYRDLDAHDDSSLYSKEEPPQHIGRLNLEGDQRLDFLIRNADAGWMGVECKNVREWLYPDQPRTSCNIKKMRRSAGCAGHHRSTNPVRLLSVTFALWHFIPSNVQPATACD